MIRNRKWYGKIGKLMKEHLELRYSLGRVSEADESYLNQYNHFLKKNKMNLNTVKRDSLMAFLKSKNLKPWGQRNLMIAVREFCRFLKSRGVNCFWPSLSLIPKLEYKIRFYHYSESDVIKMMLESSKINPRSPIVGATYSTIIGLLWTTGMRKAEVLNLEHRDVDLDNLVLTIRNTKFRKSRFIPITKCTATALRKYIKIKKRHHFSLQDQSAFFIGATGFKCSKSSLGHTFAKLIRELKIGAPYKPGEAPRLHDLRHSFATNCLKSFYQDSSLDHNVYLPVLSTFLGHKELRYSQYYLHPDFELLTQSGEKLEKKFKKAMKK